MKVTTGQGNSYDIPDFVWLPPAQWSVFQSLPATGKGTNDQKPDPLGAFEEGPNRDPNPSNGEDAAQVPYPLSDFTHIDPGTPYFDRNQGTLKNAPGFKRLAALYGHLLNLVSAALYRFNTSTSQSDYEAAREDYLKLVADLDDHEAGRGVKPGGPGYGLVIKWFHLQPGFETVSGIAKITSVNLVVKWNPHSSTSSILVP